MSNHSSVNSYDQFYTSSAVTTLSLESRDFRSPAAYIDSLRERYENQEIYARTLDPMAQWAEPGLPMSEYNKGRYAEHTFRRGGIVGLRVAEACGKLSLLQNMARVDPLDGPAESVQEGKWFDPKQGQAYLSLGKTEFKRLCVATDSASIAFSSLLRKWTGEVAQEEYAEPFFGMGFGTMAFYACRAIDLPEYDQLPTEQQIDSALKALFGPTE